MPTTEQEALKDLLFDTGKRRDPLYKSASYDIRSRTVIPPGANTGLWYDTFPNLWPASIASLKSSKEGMQQKHGIEWRPSGHDGPLKSSEVTVGKLVWMESVASCWYRDAPKCGDQGLIAEVCNRQRRLAESIAGGSSIIVLSNESRFVSGLGREHPVENGFAWHHTLGTPYLPGSGLKGMIRAWAVNEGDSDAATALLGSREDGAGRVVLLDLLPTHTVTLVADVMTPHYGPYYEKKEAPGDWHSPVPIPFLVCEQNQTWQTAILPGSRSAFADEFKKDVDTIRKWLFDAFAWQGAGAKTAVGYGRFVPLAASHAIPR